jgi:uncharacterized protein YdhG (YjbR/CyaY superfamily)/ribosomal protein S18 acetylase RimI-like enzyme
MSGDTWGMDRVVIDEAPANSPAVRWCFERYYAELDDRFADGFDVAAALPLGLEELTPPLGLALLASRAGTPVGCGALKLGDPEVAEVKRVWVAPEARGQGLGGRLMDELERRARQAGRRLARLETNGALREAQAMYRSRGYREVAPFNEERYADHWFEKDLRGDDVREQPVGSRAPAGPDLRRGIGSQEGREVDEVDGMGKVDEMDERLAAYLAGVPTEARSALDAIRAIIREVAPAARETIAYGIPTFTLEGRSVVHVAAWKRHLSLYPVPEADAELDRQVAPYRSGRGTLRFGLGDPLPLDLVRRVVERLIEQHGR